ncbi:hypothetical protein BCR34DRAFT_150291 [Clohesyomyces aquaticus]|uniref:Uncharacterized protein n=1 Tax=Clohesyomyces aquaticus TaxID=1231657 RepID=A0A1Y1YKS8_9PLEO|nr:hypothetical protein BCR34DRAFT_150291 [Clohesyomyces aquaticus]
MAFNVVSAKSLGSRRARTPRKRLLEHHAIIMLPEHVEKVEVAMVSGRPEAADCFFEHVENPETTGRSCGLWSRIPRHLVGLNRAMWSPQMHSQDSAIITLKGTNEFLFRISNEVNHVARPNLASWNTQTRTNKSATICPRHTCSRIYVPSLSVAQVEPTGNTYRTAL